MTVTKRHNLLKFFTLAAVLASSLALQACGGGNGPVGGPGGPPPNGGIGFGTVASGSVKYVTYTADISTKTVVLSTTKGTSGSVLFSSDRISVNANSASREFDASNGDKININSAFVSADSADGEDFFVGVHSESMAYVYQTYGIWLTGYKSGSGIAAVGSFGGTTSPGEVPTTGTFTYRGAAMGFHTDSGGTLYAVKSRAELSVNFSTPSFSINTTDSISVNLNGFADISAPHLDLSGSGTISGAGLSGNVSATNLSGNVAGTFYGPNAQEVGGTFELNGTGGTYIGAFGAKQ